MHAHIIDTLGARNHHDAQRVRDTWSTNGWASGDRESGGGEEAMHSLVGTEDFFILGTSWVVAAVIIAIGWRRRNRVLLSVGALLVAGALLAAVQLWLLIRF